MESGNLHWQFHLRHVHERGPPIQEHHPLCSSSSTKLQASAPTKRKHNHWNQTPIIQAFIEITQTYPKHSQNHLFSKCHRTCHITSYELKETRKDKKGQKKEEKKRDLANACIIVHHYPVCSQSSIGWNAVTVSTFQTARYQKINKFRRWWIDYTPNKFILACYSSKCSTKINAQGSQPRFKGTWCWLLIGISEEKFGYSDWWLIKGKW